MKQKGFTLVELLGVMTLLAIIFAVLAPNIMHLLENGKNDDYAEYEQNIFLAAEAYINSNEEVSASLTLNGSVSVTFQYLLQSGYLSSKVVNPKTGVTVGDEPTKTVNVTVSPGGKYKYTISEG